LEDYRYSVCAGRNGDPAARGVRAHHADRRVRPQPIGSARGRRTAVQARPLTSGCRAEAEPDVRPLQAEPVVNPGTHWRQRTLRRGGRLVEIALCVAVASDSLVPSRNQLCLK